MKTRQAKEIENALKLTAISALVVASSLYVRSAGGQLSLLLPALAVLVTALVWWLALRSVRAHNATDKTIEQIQSLTPDQFEEWVAARFRDLGHAVKVAGASGDHGIDLVAEKSGEIAIIQCKNYRSSSVGEPVLRDLFGAMHDFGATRAYLVTSGRLTRAAADWTKGKPIEVWDGYHLARLSMPSALVADQSIESAANAAREATASGPTCPKCGTTLVERRNRHTGETFLACPRYPDCRHTQPIRA